MATPKLRAAVQIEDGRWHQALPNTEDLCQRAVCSAWTTGQKALEEGHPLAENSEGPIEVSLVLSTDETVHTLNRDHRGQDKPTNVLSFPGDLERLAPGAEILIGDVILAWETCDQEASIAGKPLDQHISHLVVHGVLHLLGYDHESDDDAAEMERLEADSLARLGVPNPYDVKS